MLDKNLKVLRKRFKLSQEQVAKKINVSRQTIAKWENGESIPDINTCAALAQLYDVTLDNLVNYSDEVGGIGIPVLDVFAYYVVRYLKLPVILNYIFVLILSLAITIIICEIVYNIPQVSFLFGIRRDNEKSVNIKIL